MFRIFFAVIAGIIACGQAAAAQKTIPIMYVGDWCHESLDRKTTNYQLPSWTEGGICKKILSINPWTFYAEGWHCEPTKVREKKDCAPSGCAFIAVVVARCQPDGTVTRGKRKVFEFSRYKGNLSVTQK